MFGVQLLYDRVAALLGADTVTLNAACKPEMILVQAPFTPGIQLTAADLTECTFDGYSPIGADTVSINPYKDPATNNWILNVPPPAGGFNWQTTGVTNLPQFVYGKALVNAAGTVLYGAELFAEPLELTEADQGIAGGAAMFTLPSNGIS